jgi:hypothetical protein
MNHMGRRKEEEKRREEFHHKDTKSQRSTKIQKTARCRFLGFLNLCNSESSADKAFLFLLSSLLSSFRLHPFLMKTGTPKEKRTSVMPLCDHGVDCFVAHCVCCVEALVMCATAPASQDRSSPFTLEVVGSSFTRKLC